MRKDNLDRTIKKIIKEETTKKLINEGNPLNNWWARARGHMSRWATFGRNVASIFTDMPFSNYKLEAAWMRVKTRAGFLYNSLDDFEKDLESLYNEQVQDAVEDKLEKKQGRRNTVSAENLDQRKKQLDEFVEQMAQKAAELKGLIMDFKDARRKRG